MQQLTLPQDGGGSSISPLLSAVYETGQKPQLLPAPQPRSESGKTPMSDPQKIPVSKADRHHRFSPLSTLHSSSKAKSQAPGAPTQEQIIQGLADTLQSEDASGGLDPAELLSTRQSFFSGELSNRSPSSSKPSGL